MATVNMNQPELPAAYEPVELDGNRNVLEMAQQMATQGNGEGTLVWASRQPRGTFRPNKEWFSPNDGLYLGLILEPEFAPEVAGEIALVGLLSLGMALAESVAPLTDLRYRWPNDVLLSGSKVGGVALRRDLDAGWMVLAVSVNVATEPV